MYQIESYLTSVYFLSKDSFQQNVWIENLKVYFKKIADLMIQLWTFLWSTHYCLESNIFFYNQSEIFMQRNFITAIRIFRLFGDVFDLNAI